MKNTKQNTEQSNAKSERKTIERNKARNIAELRTMKYSVAFLQQSENNSK